MTTAAFFPWSENNHIDIQEVDEQHKALAGLVNRLHEALGEGQDKASLRATLDHLAESTRGHFLLEESLMRLTHYPGFDIHKQQHEDLMERMRTLQLYLDGEDTTITLDVLEFLREWLILHITDSDKRFGQHFQMAGLGKYAKWTSEATRSMGGRKSWWKFW